MRDKDYPVHQTPFKPHSVVHPPSLILPFEKSFEAKKPASRDLLSFDTSDEQKRKEKQRHMHAHMLVSLARQIVSTTHRITHTPKKKLITPRSLMYYLLLDVFIVLGVIPVYIPRI